MDKAFDEDTKGGEPVKLRRYFLLMIILLVAGTVFLKMSDIRYHERFDALAMQVRSDADLWREQLTHYGQDGPEAMSFMQYISPGFVKEAEYDSYSHGIYLVTRRLFFAREGILISFEEHPKVSMEENTGFAIELLARESDLRIYRLYYYWD